LVASDVITLSACGRELRCSGIQSGKEGGLQVDPSHFVRHRSPKSSLLRTSRVKDQDASSHGLAVEKVSSFKPLHFSSVKRVPSAAFALSDLSSLVAVSFGPTRTIREKSVRHISYQSPRHTCVMNYLSTPPFHVPRARDSYIIKTDMQERDASFPFGVSTNDLIVCLYGIE